nr:hypothetical protein [Marinicella sp. W31]MDC2878274.1 hypothetical protein [Marinicella sp. W31]
MLTLGSGSKSLNREINAWKASSQGSTARSLFSAFCDALDKGADPLTGGVPQIVSVDRNSPGKVLGFVADRQRYLHGLPIGYSPALTSLEWVDPLFNRMSAETLDRLSGAQHQVRDAPTVPGGIGRFFRSSGKSK